jgi:hypothetical protein
MKKFVYQLQTTGCDYLTGSHSRTISSITVFPTRVMAESRIEQFKAACIDRRVLEAPVKTCIVPLEVIADEVLIADEPCPHGQTLCHCQGHTGPWCGYCLAESKQ